MSSISAASKLRQVVLNVPGTVLLAQAGHVDRVIRFQAVPKVLLDYKGQDKNRKDEVHVFVNLDMGPGQEAWRAAMREANMTARRDRPMPEALPVAENSHEEWAVSPEDVPVIENAIAPATAETPKFACDECPEHFASEHGLKIHKGKHKRGG